MRTNSEEQSPEPSTFFTSVPLYKTASFIGENNDDEVIKIVSYNGTITSYCPKCELDLVFISENAEKSRGVNVGLAASPTPYRGQSEVHNTKSHIKTGIHTTTFHCSQLHSHTISFLFMVERDEEQEKIALTKIGQYPSLADLTSRGLKKYRKILSAADLSEFSCAVGLAAHGVGIGSFVYLRRIFERLVEDAHQLAKQFNNWSQDDEDNYNRSHMDEKIKILKDYLPPYLSDNRPIYSILSRGIHELSEEECRVHFDVLKGGIELILDEKIEIKARQSKESNIKKAIQKIKELPHPSEQH